MQKGWIAPKLFCGLGNRLFQTVAAIKEGERTGREVVFLLSQISCEHGEYKTLLNLFPSIRVVEDCSSWQIVGEDSNQCVLNYESEISEPVVLNGFFQNTKNFPSLSSRLLPSLHSLGDFQAPADLYKNSIWAIHFRFGDYCILPHHQVPLGGYYYDALQLVPKGSSLLIFSDTPSKCNLIKDEISNLGYSVSIYENSDILDTFKAFSVCRGGAICSNSTFAWWAAYFSWNLSESYKAYFPDIWILDNAPVRLFDLPFTKKIDVNFNAVNTLKSFSFI